jgi:hypothetical protein
VPRFDASPALAQAPGLPRRAWLLPAWAGAFAALALAALIRERRRQRG